MTNIEQKNKDIDRMNKERTLILQELDQYKRLSSITKEQADIIYEALQRGKYLDYIIGFVLGLVSTIVFEVARSLLLRTRNEGERASAPPK